MQERTRRSPARFLAPLALLAFVFVLFVVITGSAVDDGGDDNGRAAETQEQRSNSDDERADTGPTETTPRRQGRRTYVIKTGDTLGAISEQTGVPLERLQELNPDLDPQAMVAGQRIKLRE